MATMATVTIPTMAITITSSVMEDPPVVGSRIENDGCRQGKRYLLGATPFAMTQMQSKQDRSGCPRQFPDKSTAAGQAMPRVGIQANGDAIRNYRIARMMTQEDLAATLKVETRT